MGRKRINHEERPIRLPAGSIERARAVLAPGENVSEFLRQAVLRELRRRERKAARLVKEPEDGA